MVDLNRNKDEAFTFKLNKPVELVDLDEINTVYPDESGREDIYIQFRRLTSMEMAMAAAKELDDLEILKGVVKGWKGYTADGKEVAYSPSLLKGLSDSVIKWVLEFATAPTTVQASVELPKSEFQLCELTSIKTKAIQQNASRGHRDKAAIFRFQRMLLSASVKGWTGVYYKGKEVPYTPELVDLLPWEVIAPILAANPSEHDPEAEEAAAKN